MRRLLLPLSLLCVTLISSTAFADHIYLTPNNGSGDNFGFVGQMNGHQLFLSGGTPYDFFGIGGYASGSTFGGASTLFLYPTTIWIDGVPMEFGFPQTNSTIFISSFTLPTNDKDFTKFVDISFGATGINFDTGQTIGVGGGAIGKSLFLSIQKLDCDLRFVDMFYPPNFRCFEENGLFQQPRDLSPTVNPLGPRHEEMRTGSRVGRCFVDGVRGPVGIHEG